MLPELTPIQVRVLGCLIEKQATTPDQYPLSLNALRNACNQKSARNPVTAHTEGEVGRCVRELENLRLVREVWGARVARYEHVAGRELGQSTRALAVLCPLMLRGPQTVAEIRTNAQRLHEFEDREDVQLLLDRLAGLDPPLVAALPRQPGQKEGRYGQLLGGMPELPSRPRPAAPPDSLSQRVEDLEAAVAKLETRLDAIERKPGSC